MMKYNLNINHYLSDKDKGICKKQIVFKGFFCYMRLMAISLIIISVTHILLDMLDFPFHVQQKELVSKSNILILLLGPLLEEIIHRLWLSLHKKDVITSIFIGIFIYIGYFFNFNSIFNSNLSEITIRALCAIFIGGIFFVVPQKKYNKIRSNKLTWKLFLWGNVIWFSLMHLDNYMIDMKVLPIIIIHCLPQFCAGILFTYYRLNIGISASILSHIILNTITYLILQ